MKLESFVFFFLIYNLVPVELPVLSIGNITNKKLDSHLDRGTGKCDNQDTM